MVCGKLSSKGVAVVNQMYGASEPKLFDWLRRVTFRRRVRSAYRVSLRLFNTNAKEHAGIEVGCGGEA